MASSINSGNAPDKDEIVVSNVRRLDSDRAVAHVELSNGISLRSIWVVGLSKSQPKVSWPRTTRGLPIVMATPELKARIDTLVLGAVATA
jgi:hypothetical protein